jgi:hypothetical protein
MTDPAALAHDALTRRLIDLARQGVRPRCGDGEISYMFLSEDQRDRGIAATYCAGCVVWAECDAVGRFERFGVWASVDRTRPPGKKAAA